MTEETMENKEYRNSLKTESEYLKALLVAIETCPSCGRPFVPTPKSPDVCLAYCYKHENGQEE